MIATDRAKRSNYKKSDIAGQRFGRLIAVCPTDMRDNHGSVVWHCCCDCGNEIDVPYNSLVYCHMKSCGCQKREHETNLGRFLGHTNGTAVAMLKSTKTFSNNTTGYRGVYFVNGKYLAKIVFQKKQYHLGKYDTAEEAAEVRKHLPSASQRDLTQTSLDSQDSPHEQSHPPRNHNRSAASHHISPNLRSQGCESTG